MINRHAFIKFTGADAHESDAVPVGRVHIGLDLKDESAEQRIVRLDHVAVQQGAGLRLRRHFQKFFQKFLNTEVGHGAAEKHGCQFAL